MISLIAQSLYTDSRGNERVDLDRLRAELESGRAAGAALSDLDTASIGMAQGKRDALQLASDLYEYSIPEFEAQDHGTCELCCEEDVDLYIIPGYLSVCQSCLENEVDVCDGCGSIWVSDAIEWTYTDDGRMLCENCAEEESTNDDPEEE